MKKTLLKSLLKRAGGPVLAAMSASVFFSASPSLLFAGPLNGAGAFVTLVDTNNGAQNFQVSVGRNPNVIVMTFGTNNQGNRVVKRFLRDNGTGNPNSSNINGRLSTEVDAIVQKCFPEGSGTPTENFSGSDVQLMYDFFLNN